MTSPAPAPLPAPRNLAAELVDRGDGWHVLPEMLPTDGIESPQAGDCMACGNYGRLFIFDPDTGKLTGSEPCPFCHPTTPTNPGSIDE